MSKKSGGGIGSIIFGLLIAGCVAFGVYSIFSDGSDSVSGDYGFNTDADSVDAVKYDVPLSRTMYNRLDSDGKMAYGIIRDALASGKQSAFFTGYKNEDAFIASMRLAYDAVYYDFPEFFWINGGWKADYHTQNGQNGILMNMGFYDYWQYISDKSGAIDKVMTEAGKIAAMANQQNSDYDKMKFIHDYLVVNAEYDYVCLEELNQTVQRASNQQSHSVYGCLVNKVCVCDGYAKTFKLIMNIAGLECEYWEGVSGPTGHAWNYVIIDGEEYWMDITWDENEVVDSNGKLAAPHGACYNYFCVEDDYLYKTHEPDTVFKLPVCDSDKYNFYQYEKSYLEEYDFDAVSAAVNEQEGSQIIHIKFANRQELLEAEKELWINGKIKEIDTIKNRLNGYVISGENAHYYVLSIYLK